MHDIDSGIGRDGLEGVAELRVTIRGKKALSLEDAVGKSGCRELHELYVRVGGRLQDLDSARCVIDREQDVVRDEATDGPDSMPFRPTTRDWT